MGVSGTGKTTVGRALAQTTGWQFADADDYHSEANRAKMHAGIPLTDEDRESWLQSLHEQLAAWTRENGNGILACSALRASYRITLTAGLRQDAIRLVYLTGPQEVIRQRLEQRHGHYMPPSLLPSQLAILEPPRDAIEISIMQPVSAMVEEILRSIGGAAYAEENGTKSS